MRAVLVEFEAIWEHPEENRARIAALEPGAADLVVLPEMALSGFSMYGRVDAGAEAFFADVARRRGCALAAGWIGEGPRNVAGIFDSQGRELARYAKLHPFSFAGEDRVYRPGADLPLFTLGGLRWAPAICYDLRFPELFREAALRGAEAFVVIANWPARRVDHWHALLRARAIENQAYVLGVNRGGRDPNETYVSSSLAVDPRGAVLHEGPGAVELDPSQVRQWREAFPALRDIRRDRYRFGDA